ncbi:MAG: ATP-dependent DNA ligase [Euryarchaeota archaeon]|nr:ATP-dependent DNA ligase [Euryarchaeota archaeon]
MFSKLADYMEKLEKTPSYLEKTQLIVSLLKETSPEDTNSVVLLLLGRVYPAYVSLELGMGVQLVKRAVASATGYDMNVIDKEFAKTGDLGVVVQKLLEKKRQVTLFRKPLTVKRVHEILAKIPEMTGAGSQDLRINSVIGLLNDADPLEARFIVRTVLGESRTGVAEGRLRDAIAEAFNVPPELVEQAYTYLNDHGEVAKIAAEEGAKGLEKVGPIIGRPLNVMLAQRVDTIDEILERMGGKAAWEWKLDGMRILVHKDNEKIKLFTRRQEDVTSSFPDLVEAQKTAIKAKTAIVDGEMIATDSITGKPMPFQEVLKRRRKYEIKEKITEIPVSIQFFDILLLNNKNLMGEPYLKRRQILENTIKPIPDKVSVVKQLVSGNKKEIEKFMKESLKAGHEGLLVKELNSVYRAGRREFLWLKFKPEVETIDVAVVGAWYGKGKRAGTFGSYLVAVRNEEDEKFYTITKVGSGLTDEQLEEFTKMFKEIIAKTKPEEIVAELEPNVWFKPNVVWEIVYEEIQPSPHEKHTSSFGLRFPRFVKIREDKNVNQVNTVEEVRYLYEKQEKRKGKAMKN